MPPSPSTMHSISIASAKLRYWLVNHPKILHFSWTPGQTLGSTPQFLALTILSYLSLTLLLALTRRRRLLPALGPAILKPITALHSLTLSLLSFIMAVGCTLSMVTPGPGGGGLLRRAVCFPPATPPSGPLFFWAYVFYLSKILELVDTLLIIMSNSIDQRLTFLHVYHHGTVLVMCYVWLQTSQSLFPVALVTNASVHVVMYCYYMLSAVGVRPRWKRLVTDCQIIQFVFSFGISGLMLYYHFNVTGPEGGCSGILGWCFNAVFNASLLALFVDFHAKSYRKKKRISISNKDK